MNEPLRPIEQAKLIFQRWGDYLDSVTKTLPILNEPTLVRDEERKLTR